MATDSNKEHIIIVGAGLCGTLLGIRMAQRGYRVDIYEQRGDMRLVVVDGGRSINLALSHRGLWGLETVGLRDHVAQYCIPMHGRMIHTSGQERFSPYSGRDDEYINSISRPGLNTVLLEKADTYDNLTLHFNHRCTGVDIATATARFVDEHGTEVTAHGDLLVGTDGAGSMVRQGMMAKAGSLLFNFSQQFLRSGYKELTIPAAADGSHRIATNALHIWPRGAFMMIALPNLDGSFTVTMFHPFTGEAGFHTLDTPTKVRAFFEQHYADALPHLVDLDTEYFENPTSALGTVKCSPWQAHGKTLLMGDAAHAIVPFYGQGMNAAFEDVRVFDETIDAYDGDWQRILPAYSDTRPTNTNAIADLAIDNFQEMQDKVADPVFIKKRQLEMLLEERFPDYYSKYSLVTFKPELSYAEAMEHGRRQDAWLLDYVKDKDPNALDLEAVLRELRG